MNSPYIKELKKLKENGHDVTISRAESTDVTGKVKSVNEDGCHITASEGLESLKTTFIAHRDIRGISSVGWNMDVIAN